MCRINNITTKITGLDFTKERGKMAVFFSDGREMIIPLSLFPDIKSMTVKDRKNWMILDDQFFTFEKNSRIYSITDLLAVNWFVSRKQKRTIRL